MTNLQKRLKLANEAKELIVEFRNEESRIAEITLEEISISEDGFTIYVEDNINGKMQYELTEISSIFSSEMRGWGPCSASFYESVSIAQSDAGDEYNNMEKEEFIQYVGGLYYMEYRCEEIYKRLEEIESEAADLHELEENINSNEPTSNRQIRLDIGVGAIFDSKKLVVTKHVGSTLTNEQYLNIENEVMMLSCGPEVALPSDAMGILYNDLAPLQSRIGNPSDIVCYVMNAVDNETGETIEEIHNEFDKVQTYITDYKEKGYDFKCFGYVFENIEKYELNSETMKKLNLLEIEADKFELIDMLNEVQESLSRQIGEEDIFMNLRKSKLVDYIFVATETEDENTEELVKRLVENDGKIYVPFVRIVEDKSGNDLPVLVDEELSYCPDIDQDEMNAYILETCYGTDFGILVESKDKMLSFKGVSYIPEAPSGQKLVQVKEDIDIYEKALKDFLENFKIF